MDQEAAEKAGRVMTLAQKGQWADAVDEAAGTFEETDETMPIRVDYDALKARRDRLADEAEATTEPDPGPIPLPKPDPTGRSQWSGPFPIRRAGTTPPPIVGGISFKRVTPEVIEEEPVPEVEDVTPEDKPADDSKGVEHETGTYAIAALTKVMGERPAHVDLHRTAQRIQQAFNEAGWNISVWFGGYTQEFWVMDDYGLHGGCKTVTDMYREMGWQSL